VDFQHCIIGRCWLESDIRMPPYTRETTCIAELVSKTTALLLLLRANHTNLITELTSFFGQRVNVEARSLRLRRYD
jgi:hypothetical protein